MRTTKTYMTKFRNIGLCLGAALALFAAPAEAAFPEKPITIIVAYAAGGGTDTAVRALTDVMSEKLGQPVLVQNVTGAGGGVAAIKLKQSAPDGYTLLATNSTSITLEPQVNKTLFTLDDFVTVAMIGEFQGAVFAPKGKPYKNLDEMVKWAQTEKKPIKFASFLALDRLVMRYIAKKRGFEVIPVPVNGANGAVQAVLAGDVDAAYSGGSWSPIVQAGDAVALFATAHNRLRFAPDLIGMKDMGYPFGVTSFIPLMAPKGTPKDVMAKIAAALEPAVKSELAQSIGQKRYMDMTFQPHEQAEKTMRAEHEAYAEIIKTVGK